MCERVFLCLCKLLDYAIILYYIIKLVVYFVLFLQSLPISANTNATADNPPDIDFDVIFPQVDQPFEGEGGV